MRGASRLTKITAISGEGFIGILNKFNKTLLSFSRNNIGTYMSVVRCAEIVASHARAKQKCRMRHHYSVLPVRIRVYRLQS